MAISAFLYRTGTQTDKCVMGSSTCLTQFSWKILPKTSCISQVELEMSFHILKGIILAISSVEEVFTSSLCASFCDCCLSFLFLSSCNWWFFLSSSLCHNYSFPLLPTLHHASPFSPWHALPLFSSDSSFTLLISVVFHTVNNVSSLPHQVYDGSSLQHSRSSWLCCGGPCAWASWVPPAHHEWAREAGQALFWEVHPAASIRGQAVGVWL